MDAKICGIKDTNTLDYIINHKYPPKYIGFITNYKKSKRYVPFEKLRKLINVIEKTIIDTLKDFEIKSFADKKNIGIWHKNNEGINKIAAIGIKVKNWIAYHGFSINISNDIKKYNKIIPCGIKDKNVTNLNSIKKQNYIKIKDILIKNFLTNIEN